MKLTNNEPLTWACECGQLNLLTELHCVTCSGHRDEVWEPADRATILSTIEDDPETPSRIVGFSKR